MITVCLLNPPISISKEARRIVTPPLGLTYLAAILRQNPQNKVTILDCVAEGPMREQLAVPGYVTVGLSMDEIAMRLSQERPAVCGVSFVSSDQARNAHQVCERIKQLKRDKDVDITVIAGGPHVSAFPKDVMADINVDYAIIGEGEIPLFKLCEYLGKFKTPEDIPGVCWRDKSNKLHINRELEFVPDLDLIPYPARDLLQMQRYMFGDSYYGDVLKPHATMMLTRGCVFSCPHCQVPRTFGKEYRKRSPESIADEMLYLSKNYGVREIQIVGDNLFDDRAWAHQWMLEVIDHSVDVKWSTLSGQSLNNLDAGTARLAVESGLRQIMIDFPTGDEDAYESIYERPGSLTGVKELIVYLRKSGVYVGGLFSLGAPGESMESMSNTIVHAMSLPLDEIRFRAMTPFPGTPMWDSCIGSDLFERVPGADELMFDGGYVRTKVFAPKDVMRLLHMAQTRIALRDFLRRPEERGGDIINWVRKFLLHPFGSVVNMFRFAGSWIGFVGPAKRRRVRKYGKKKKVAAAPSPTRLKKEEDF